MDEKQYSEYFSPPELGSIIRRFKLYISPRSPLVPFRDVDAAFDKRSFEKKIDDESAWKDTITALASPGQIISSTIAGPAGTLASSFYGPSGAKTDTLTGCWADKDGLRISFPWNPWRVATIAGMALAARHPDPVPIPPFTLTPPGLTALAAVIDVVRQSDLSDLEARRTSRRESFSAASIVDQASVGFAHDDRRWVVTLLRDLSSPSTPIRFEYIENGFDELLKAGAIRSSKGAWQPAEWIRHLAHIWRIPLPAAAHQSIVFDDDHATGIEHIIAIRGEGPLWVMRYDGIMSKAPSIHCSVAEHPDYLKALVAMMHPPPEPSTQSAKQAFCSACGAAIEPGVKFCTSCGHPLNEK